MREGNVTLHIGIVAQSRVVQGGDRRLSVGSKGSMKIWDPIANKTLVLACQNATAVLSYSGLSFVDGLPTDDWLARAILSRDLDPPFREGAGRPLRVDDSIKFTLGEALSGIEGAIRSDFTRQSAANRALGLSLLMSGYTWKRPRGASFRPRPFQLNLRYDNDPSRGYVVRESVPRWFPPNRCWMDWIGSGTTDRVKLQRMADLLDKGLLVSESEVGSAVAACIRAIAIDSVAEGVGTESHVITIGRDQNVEVCFVRDPGSPEHVSYSPWVLGAGTSFPPSVQAFWAGPHVGFTGGRKVTLVSDPPTQSARYRGTSGQKRKMWTDHGASPAKSTRESFS
jgi:hypothetical protein